MKRNSVWIAAFVLVASTAFAGEPRHFDGDGFRLAVPDYFGEFAKQQQKSATEQGEVVTTTWVSKAPTGEVVIVSLSEMPGKILEPAKMMASGRDSLLASLKAKAEEESAADDSLRVYFKTQTANPIFGRTRFVVDGKRLYDLVYVTRTADARKSEIVEKLFESFRLHGR